MKYTCNMSLLRYVQEARLMTTLFPGSFISPAPPPGGGGGLTPSYGLYRDLPAGQGMVFCLSVPSFTELLITDRVDYILEGR